MLYSSCLCKWSIFTMLLDESYHSPFLEDDSTSNLNNVEHFVCTRIISYHSPFFQYGSSCKKKKLYLEFYSFSLSLFFFIFPFFLFFFFSLHLLSSHFFSFLFFILFFFRTFFFIDFFFFSTNTRKKIRKLEPKPNNRNHTNL